MGKKLQVKVSFMDDDNNDEELTSEAYPASGTVEAAPNVAPVFTTSETFDVAENQTAVGTVQATDADADDGVPGYTIEGGADLALFVIGLASGELAFNTAPNYEAAASADGNNTYVVDVRATSGTGIRAKTTDQTITVTVTDVDEPPLAPDAPRVSSASVVSVAVTWVAPTNAGPAIEDYDYRSRVKDPEGSWVEVTNTTITALTVTIEELAENTEYEVAVRATNAEGTGEWSDPGSGSTDANAAPAFSSSATFDVAENQTAVGTVQATDDGDDVTGYTIEGGADGALFVIGLASGDLAFNTAPNYEDPTDADGNNTYVVDVRATSGVDIREKTAGQTITVTVTDVGGEKPGVPGAPTVSTASVVSVTATWVAPSNAGPAIEDYDYRSRVKDPEGSWVEVTNTPITALSATIDGLAENTEYDVQVRATNAEGMSEWSEAGSGSTDANAAPVFTTSETFDVAENQTAVGTVQATDDDDGVTGYTIEGGADEALFVIGLTSGSGELAFNTAPNYEAAASADGNNTYVVDVRATSGAGIREKTADQTITVTVTDVGGEKPGVPGAPTVSTASAVSVTAAWVAPSNAGPAIEDYDYRSRVKDPEGSWVEVTDTTITALTVTIEELAENTEYEVAVRATNAEGTGEWSDPGSGSTGTNVAPAFSSSETFDVAENQTAVGTVQATDADDDVTGYTIEGGADGALFVIGLASGEPGVQHGTELRGPDRRRRQQHLRGGRARHQWRGHPGEDDRPDDHGDRHGRGRREAGRSGRAEGVGGVGGQRDRDLGGALQRRTGDRGLRLPVPGEGPGGLVGRGDGHADHRVERDDRWACRKHRVRRPGAGDQRRGHGSMVRGGQRIDGRQRGAGVHHVRDVRRRGEPDRCGDGASDRRRRRRRRDGLHHRGRR